MQLHPVQQKRSSSAPTAHPIAALGIATNMAVAIATVHRAVGFFMNWNGTQKGEGFEFHLLVLAIAGFLMIRGAGGSHATAFLPPRGN